jgi:propionyl-CoA synthetase
VLYVSIQSNAYVSSSSSSSSSHIHICFQNNETTTYTYAELLDHVSKFAGVLADQGVRKGDRVVIYMPMVPEAVRRKV